MKIPTVGIMPLVDTERESLWMLPGYMNGIISAGAIPVMLPLISDKHLLEQLSEQYDGFLFTGGHDVSPKVYGETPLPCCGECCRARDEMESALFPILYEKNKPVLGICRGIQFINAILGGTLYQDLNEQYKSNTEHHQSPPYDIPVHSVKIADNTPLRALLNRETIHVNSYHHQAIKNLSSKLQAMAYSEDGLIEGIYAPEKSYIWAVQWHPEFSCKNDDNSRLLFKSFIDAMSPL